MQVSDLNIMQENALGSGFTFCFVIQRFKEYLKSASREMFSPCFFSPV